MKLTQQQHDTIKEASNEYCEAIVVEKIEKDFKVNRNLARKMYMAVLYDYKYLKVI